MFQIVRTEVLWINNYDSAPVIVYRRWASLHCCARRRRREILYGPHRLTFIGVPSCAGLAEVLRLAMNDDYLVYLPAAETSVVPLIPGTRKGL